ncbi:hypothetical protein [Halomonas binhaiensis]|uniref:Uncharacterized protein n=1 Tax=Halomonas binhaiensis TaxID=2562282 RepID=A0A5C1NGD8_9GAMM|nr:hypothetical protein [Halomonas binhaiensis]QEM81703.1 hypothetical protein E4T21_09205 [Halomonas binhaiensis]
MPYNYRGGWELREIEFKLCRKHPVIAAKMTNGNETISPSIELPENYKSLTLWDVIDLLWREAPRELP